MWLFAILVTALLSFTSHASIQVKAQIYDVDTSVAEEPLILLTTGHVVRLKNHNLKSFQDLSSFRDNKQWFAFTLTENHELEAYQLAEEPKSFIGSISLEDTDETYTPTIVESLDQAKAYFKEGRYVHKESQCYNRAHVWSYEWFLKHTVYSNKTWIFFTRKYIRKFKFEWWFHVSPSMHVRENGVVKEKIMDVKYSSGPVDLKRWTDIFMRNDAHCPQVKTYSDYANYPESGWCYTMRTSMFYYQPYDIETKENWGTIKGNWYDSEVKAAYLEAFDETI